MRLMSLEIQNYRGIKHSYICFPQDSRIICLIGPGDSGKSTLLKAIEWVLWPAWNLIATDADFYNGDTEQPITISATIAEVPEELLREDKYGLYQRDFAGIILGNDEPTDKGLAVLTICLTIDSSLEPKWEVITNRAEPKAIGYKDRKLLSFGSVGMDQEKDFQWGRNSVLQKYTDSRDALHGAFMQAMRAAIKETNLDKLDEATPKIKSIGGEYGVAFNGELHNRLLMQNGSYSTAVGMFDDNVPFVQRGLGSKRLLSIGMNVSAYSDGTLVLVDEVETGLEPYRISSLINQFRSQFKKSGQVIMTTHSRSAVCECNVNELCVVNMHDGELTLNMLNEVKDIQGDVQGIIRREPDAFLCKRIIVCEGKTEIGLLRSYDNHLFEETQKRFAHYGIGLALGGGGNNFFKLARLLKKCGYDCCILMDSDISKEEAEKEEMVALGIPVFSWELGNAIEEQIFKDVSVSCAEQLIAYAIEICGIPSVVARLDNEFEGETKQYRRDEDAIVLCGDAEGNVDREVMRRIGTVAKGKPDKNKENTYTGCWFKRIDRGQEIGDIIFSSDDQIDEKCHFRTVMRNLRNWVIGHE